MLGFRLHPAVDVLGETALRQRLQQEGLQLGGHREAVDRRGFLRRIPRQRFPLNELPLHRIERRQLVMAGLQIAQFRFDPEQRPGEILHVRSQFDDQLRCRLRRQRGRIPARFDKPFMQRRRGFFQLFQEDGVDFREAFVRSKGLQRQVQTTGLAFSLVFTDKKRFGRPARPVRADRVEPLL